VGGREVTREFYYQRDREYVPGRVILVGANPAWYPTPIGRPRLGA